MELRPRPFEAMIFMAKSASSQSSEKWVVFGIRRCDDHYARRCMFEQHALERRQTGRIKMFDHLDNCRSVVPAQSLVSVHQ